MEISVYSLTRIPSRYLRGFLYNVLKASTGGRTPTVPHNFAAKKADEKNCDYSKIGRKELRLMPCFIKMMNLLSKTNDFIKK